MSEFWSKSMLETFWDPLSFTMLVGNCRSLLLHTLKFWYGRCQQTSPLDKILRCYKSCLVFYNQRTTVTSGGFFPDRLLFLAMIPLWQNYERFFFPCPSVSHRELTPFSSLFQIEPTLEAEVWVWCSSCEPYRDSCLFCHLNCKYNSPIKQFYSVLISVQWLCSGSKLTSEALK